MKRRFPSLMILIALFALTASAAWAGDAKVQVCHIPPGNPANFHTITISENALQAHLGHGDLAGACFAHCDSLCSDGNACTIDACDASERCVAAHPPVNCDDSSLCTIDSCNPASGCANVPKTCLDSNNCTVDACDPLTGSCVAPPVSCPVGQSCNPANGACASSATCPCTEAARFGASTGFNNVLIGPSDLCSENDGVVATLTYSFGEARASSSLAGSPFGDTCFYTDPEAEYFELSITPQEALACVQLIRAACVP